MNMDPQQELFTALMLSIRNIGYDVYDGALPPEGTPYPFVYMGTSHIVDKENKTAVFGDVYQTIHIWHSNPQQRGTVSEIAGNIKRVARELIHTDNFAWRCAGISQQILHDSTTRQPLIHAVIELDFSFS